MTEIRPPVIWTERPEHITPLSPEEQTLLTDVFTTKIRGELLKVPGAEDIDFVLDNALTGLVRNEPKLIMIDGGKNNATSEPYRPYPILEWKDKRLVDEETLKESQIGKHFVMLATTSIDDIEQNASYETPASQVVIKTTGLKNPDEVQKIYDAWGDIVGSSEGVPDSIKKTFESRMKDISNTMKPLYADIIFSGIHYNTDERKIDRETLGKITIGFSLDGTARVIIAGADRTKVNLTPEEANAFRHLVQLHTVGNETA